VLKYLSLNFVVVQLQHGRISAKVQAALLALVMVAQSVLGRRGLIGPLAILAMRPFAALQLLFVIAAVWVGYQANGGASGRDFLTRYFTLSCLIYLWVNAVGYVLYYVVYLAFYYSPWLEAENAFRLYGPAQLAFFVITASAFLVLLQRYMRRVSLGDAP